MSMVLAAVELSSIVEVIWAALLAALLVAILYAIVILMGARAAEARRNRQGFAAGIFAGVATVAFAGVLGLVGFGIATILDKS